MPISKLIHHCKNKAKIAISMLTANSFSKENLGKLLNFFGPDYPIHKNNTKESYGSLKRVTKKVVVFLLLACHLS